MPVSKEREFARLRAFYQKRGPKPGLKAENGSNREKGKRHAQRIGRRRSKYDNVDMAVASIALRSISRGLCKTPNEAVRKAVDTVRVFGGVELPKGSKPIDGWTLLRRGKPNTDYTENMAKMRYEDWGESIPVEMLVDESGFENPVAKADFGDKTRASNLHVLRIIRKMKRDNII